MNTVAKGNRYERLCMKEYERYLNDTGRVAIARWHASRTRFGGNDFLSGWDISFLTTTNDFYRDLHLIQVKPSYSDVEMRKLRLLRFGSSFLAVYKTRPREYKFKTKNFYFIEV
jgi:hypothetical protein